ncbi:MAG: hypothetical protein ABEJ35_00770, partial [Halobacteriaceae archaeon]
RNPTAAAWTKRVLDRGCTSLSSDHQPPAAVLRPPNASTPVSWDFGRTPDVALVELLGGGGGGIGIERLLDAAGRLEYRRQATRRLLTRNSTSADTVPGWQAAGVTRTTAFAIEPVNTSFSPRSTGWATVQTISRRVTITTTVTKHWAKGARRRNTTGQHRRTFLVHLSILGRAAPMPGAPGRLTGSARAAALRRGVPTAQDRLVGNRTARNRLFRAVALGESLREVTTVSLALDHGAKRRIRQAAVGLSERLHNQTISVPRTGLVRQPPADRLSTALRARASDLLRSHPPYESLADRAAAAGQRLLLADVRRQVRQMGRDQDRLFGAIEGLLREAGLSAAHLGASAAFLDDLTSGSTETTDVSVAAAPSYLVRTAIGSEQVPGLDGTYYPLAARNTNHVTVPWDRVADGLVGGLLEAAGTVSLEQASRVFRASDSLPARHANATFRTAQSRLGRELSAAVAAARERLVDTLVVRTSLPRSAATSVVEEALAQHPNLSARASAVVEGTLATTVAAAVGDEGANRTVTQGLLAARLRTALREVRRSARPSEGIVDPVVNHVRDRVTRRVQALVESGVRNVADRLATRWTGRSLRGLPAGLPVTPVPGGWYATANLWTITVRGGYARFAVSAPTDDPMVGPRGELIYQRRNHTVRLDVDRDGRAERLGANRRIEFAVRTAVVVAVPPGAQGIGDTNGVRTETSPGWNATAGDKYGPAETCLCFSTSLPTSIRRREPTRKRPTAAGLPRSSTRWVWTPLLERPVLPRRAFGHSLPGIGST